MYCMKPYTYAGFHLGELYILDIDLISKGIFLLIGLYTSPCTEVVDFKPLVRLELQLQPYAIELMMA